MRKISGAVIASIVFGAGVAATLWFIAPANTKDAPATIGAVAAQSAGDDNGSSRTQTLARHAEDAAIENPMDPPEDIGGSKPPLFKPSMPPNWTWHQMQVATQALNALFTACPNLSTWMPDMWKPSIYIDKSTPLTADFERQLFAPMGWSDRLVVSIITVPKPHNPMFEGDGNAVVFYLGTGKRTGIFMQGGFFPLAACGGKPTYTFRTQLDRSYDTTEAPDTFIAVPALEILKNFQPHGTNPK